MDFKPSHLGIPTFDEYKSNRDHYHEKYYGREDDNLIHDDKGSSILGRYVKKHIYEVNGYACRSLEQVETTVHSMGHKISDMKVVREIIPLAGKWCNIKIRYLTPDQAKKREAW